MTMAPYLSEPAHPQGINPASQNGGMISREEHAQRMRELNLKRGLMKTPRRGWSLTDHHTQHDAGHHYHAAVAPVEVQAIPENAAVPASSMPPPVQQQKALPQRPKLPPPRRSQSVTDKEPEPVQERPTSARLGLLDLPPELHYDIFDFLDPIDGVCFGLVHSKLYDIHHRKYGTVPLSSRYSGPNDREWAWRGAGAIVNSKKGEAKKDGAVTEVATQPVKKSDLDNMRVKSQVYCRKCGISRCELHRHLKEWFGPEYQYCEIKAMYGAPAAPDAKPYCYMSSPKNPHRCGRHGSKKVAPVVAAKQ